MHSPIAPSIPVPPCINSLLWQGFDGKPAATHTIVACPVSLVTNWESEPTKK